MKRFLITALILSIPLTVWAEADQPVQPISPEDRPPLEQVRKHKKRRLKKAHLENANSNTNATAESEAEDKPIDLPIQARLHPELKDLHDLKPKDPAEAFEFHQDLLEQRIDRIQDNTAIPEDKKEQIVTKFTEELTWMEEKHQALEAATTEDERSAIRAEIIEHVHTVQTERRQTLADTVALPKQSPTGLAQQMNDRFAEIAQRFTDAGKDTTELNSVIAQYQAAVAELDSNYAAVQAGKTVETLQNLRDSIQKVRDAAAAVRNAVQSIV